MMPKLAGPLLMLPFVGGPTAAYWFRNMFVVLRVLRVENAMGKGADDELSTPVGLFTDELPDRFAVSRSGSYHPRLHADQQFRRERRGRVLVAGLQQFAELRSAEFVIIVAQFGPLMAGCMLRFMVFVSCVENL